MTRDLVLGLATLAIAAVYYALAAAMPETLLADAVGPAGLPKVYAVALGGLSLILIAQSLVRRAPRGGADTDADADADADAGRRTRAAEFRSLWRAAGVLLIGVLYVALVPWLGYVVAIAGLIVATTVYHGGTLDRRTVLVACSGALFFWVLFVWMLRIPQPPGVWPTFL